MKFSLPIISIILAVISLSNSSSAQLRAAFPNNLFECDPSRANIIVLQRILNKQGRPNTYTEDTIVFPRMGLLPAPITCIAIEDLSRGGAGGYPDIVSGGVNYNNVIISFKSLYGGSLRFSVLIYTDIRRFPIGSSLAQNITAV